MSQSEKQRSAAASAVGGKTARACDGCLRRRARWYCPADDAFLCQGCDASVHSANPLARRHQRLRLNTSSSIPKSEEAGPTWHHGFKRKARTPRPHHNNKQAKPLPVPPFVPEVETSAEDENNNGEEEEQLLYRVPIFDPILAEFYSPPLLNESTADEKPAQLLENTQTISTSTTTNDCLSGFLPSDMELEEFAADMESLLGHNDSFSMEELGLVDSRSLESDRIKEELDDDTAAAGNSGGIVFGEGMDLSRETLDINFDCGSPTTGEEAEEVQEGKGKSVREVMVATDSYYPEAKRVGLRLDYESIIATWSANGSSSPWTNGERPQFGPDDCWLDFMEMWGGGEVAGVMQLGEAGGGHVDVGREARVTRYREKRRTRLFSKKIRYEVRKLNAEKRPRMKGRFVKRASFAAASTAFPY